MHCYSGTRLEREGELSNYRRGGEFPCRFSFLRQRRFGGGQIGVELSEVRERRTTREVMLLETGQEAEREGRGWGMRRSSDRDDDFRIPPRHSCEPDGEPSSCSS